MKDYKYKAIKYKRKNIIDKVFIFIDKDQLFLHNMLKTVQNTSIRTNIMIVQNKKASRFSVRKKGKLLIGLPLIKRLSLRLKQNLRTTQLSLVLKNFLLKAASINKDFIKNNSKILYQLHLIIAFRNFRLS